MAKKFIVESNSFSKSKAHTSSQLELTLLDSNREQDSGHSIWIIQFPITRSIENNHSIEPRTDIW